MPSTPTTSLRLELQQTGEALNQWGERLNQALQMVEQAVCGVLIKPLTGNVTLQVQNFVSDEARNATLIFTTGPGLVSSPTITVPPAPKSWHVSNRTSYPLVFTMGGTTVTVPVGRLVDIYCDGSNLFMLDPVTVAVAGAIAGVQPLADQAATSATSAASSAGTATTAKNTAVDNKNYAQEWANKAIGSLISAAAGGNGSSDYSARHFANSSSAFANAASGSASAASTSASAADASKTAAASSANAASGSATASQTARTGAETARDAAANSSTSAATSATSASQSASNASTSATQADTSKQSAGNFANAAQTAKEGAVAAQGLAQTAATQAQEGAARLVGTSATTQTISAESKTFTTQAGKAYGAGSRVAITSDGAPDARIMNGLVTAYSGTALTVAVDATTGGGTFTDWTIRLSGLTGLQGPAGLPAQIAVFDASGTWTKPTSAKRVDVFIQAPGGGGSSGERRASGTVSRGGSGGGGGGSSAFSYSADDLPATVPVTLGAAGSGGASVTSDNATGNAGTNAGNAQFGGVDDAFFLAASGGQGSSGVSAVGAAGAGGTASALTYAASSATGGSVAASAANLARSHSGGSGAGQTTTPGNYDGGIVQLVAANTLVPLTSKNIAIAGQRSAGATKTNAIGPTQPTRLDFSTIGVSGPGGWSSSDGTAGDGANGSVGSGGGGGGGSLNGNLSGKGGNGGPGRIVIVTHF
ncbi:glycine-rich domain-containing protein [Aureimonas pseudogalii]|uniref:Glycine-rich domain-containing protein n=1 Tax=Aureimonas pseudogalii TaxID=1744844 RepID=A0A7W6EAA2_9HYPH|nr:hypothetical protein [Aureimonas pseudogalii]MBB3997194.1 hypothetical protein [Aureimonas pseudogalii]